MHNIILCGGSGTRLWPLSRTKLPKQFVRLFDQQSLFQQTLKRNLALCDHVCIVTNSEHYFLALDQMQEGMQQYKHHATTRKFLLEPVGRNTAPAIALACMTLDPEEMVLVTPADHLIKDQQAYIQAVQQAKTAASNHALITFGIKPTGPETGFGYIEAIASETPIQNVQSFREKPSKTEAEHYITQSNFYWNSGMFCFKAGIFLEELQKHGPDIYAACVQAWHSMERQDDVLTIAQSKMLAIPENSVDYAVMEHSDRVNVIPCALGWSDLGSFDALYQESKIPEKSNAIVLQGQQAQSPVVLDSQNNLIVAGDRQIALIDVEELVVVDTPDALLISQKKSSQKVRQVVQSLMQSHPELTEVHRLAYRPWGSYEVLVDTAGYKVKRIIVKPSGQLSLQKHMHRNEHWIVVSGTASVTVDENTFLLRPNESTYIKMGQVHRLENHGKIDLAMIEVQVGEYTGEDDIVRFDDRYGRS